MGSEGGRMVKEELVDTDQTRQSRRQSGRWHIVRWEAGRNFVAVHRGLCFTSDSKSSPYNVFAQAKCCGT